MRADGVRLIAACPRGSTRYCARLAGPSCPWTSQRILEGLRQEPRERGPRRAPAGGARRGANVKALVAIETQGELSQREMHPRSKQSPTVDHRRMTSGTGTRPSQPPVATVTPLK